MQLLPPSKGFLHLPDDQGFSYDDARSVIIPFGLEASVTYGGGTRHGPQAMIDASPELELFDEILWCEPYRDFRPITMAEPNIASTQEDALCQLDTLVEQVLIDGKFPCVFGGEHAITAGAIRPFARRYDDLVILHFDAHADLRDGYLGAHYSHASAMRRCLDDDAVAQRGQHITLLSYGIRNISAEEIPFLEAQHERIHIHWAHEKASWDMDILRRHVSGKPVYLSFDVDGFDASLMPATGTPEPGGLFWDDAIHIIAEAAHHATIVGADINELSPIKGMHSCDFIAAKLAHKILSYAVTP